MEWLAENFLGLVAIGFLVLGVVLVRAELKSGKERDFYDNETY